MIRVFYRPCGASRTEQHTAAYELLDAAEDVEKTYLEVVLPDKMKYNLAAINSFSFIDDIKVMILTVLAIIRK